MTYIVRFFDALHKFAVDELEAVEYNNDTKEYIEPNEYLPITDLVRLRDSTGRLLQLEYLPNSWRLLSDSVGIPLSLYDVFFRLDKFEFLDEKQSVLFNKIYGQSLIMFHNDVARISKIVGNLGK